MCYVILSRTMNTIHCYIPTDNIAVTLQTDKSMTDEEVKTDISNSHNVTTEQIIVRSRHLTDSFTTKICGDCCDIQQCRYRHYSHYLFNANHDHLRFEDGSSICKDSEQYYGTKLI